MTPIVPTTSVNPAATTPSVGAPSRASTSESNGFGNLIESFVQNTNQAQVTSDQSIQNLIEGKTDNVQQVVMAVANAEMSFQLFMEVRNKLIDSYNELMRMQF